MTEGSPDPSAPSLASLWQKALSGSPAELEAALASGSRLPGPRANLELAGRLADLAAGSPDRNAALALLTRWLASPPQLSAAVPPGQVEFLAACAALAAGALGARELLTSAARDDRWRVRELAATGAQRMLAADWTDGLALARTWLESHSPLLVRAAVAAVAEPPLLHDPRHAVAACEVVEDAVDLFLVEPPTRRRDDDVRVLRQALGYAVSVVTVAAPDEGVPLLERLATAEDADAHWIARQNLGKARLRPLAERLAVAQQAADAAVSRPRRR
ncbi:hypothetical protein P5G50_07255 [Leifsonia sp. F6_8S_P_1B]|uniref:HEAT repeat-containing protein n=1 Tax=Leifsonia williamsii TaxID=3035919 RepID=A0ABT8K9W6_9MICO|nr:hypothetical protein [Leifsonia williamsii]MDN4614246.1 hypothetical protein [Leifsonia williamsii]